MVSKTIDTQIVICGRGGQGVLFLTRLLDEVALTLGNNVISSETHGMAMRGGSVASHIKIGDYHSPLIRAGQGDILIALTESEIPLCMHLLKKEGRQVYLNSPCATYGTLDADHIAKALGSIVTSNLVLLGFASGHPEFPLEYGTIHSTLSTVSPPKLKDLNLRALTEGYTATKNKRGKAP